MSKIGHVIATIGIILFAIFYTSGWWPYGYIFVLTGPEEAIPNTKPIIYIPNFKVNGEKMIFSNEWEIQSPNPESWFGGLNKFVFRNNFNRTDDYATAAGVYFQLNKNTDIEIGFQDISLSIDNKSFSAEKDLSVSSCKKNNEQLIEQLQGELPDIKADIQIKEFWQGFKKVVIKADIKNIKTTLYPHPYITCVNGVPVRSTEEPIEFEIPEMSIDIDSWFTYIWSNKGGTTYKL